MKSENPARRLLRVGGADCVAGRIVGNALAREQVSILTRNEGVGDVRADESGSAGDQNRARQDGPRVVEKTRVILRPHEVGRSLHFVAFRLKSYLNILRSALADLVVRELFGARFDARRRCGLCCWANCWQCAGARTSVQRVGHVFLCDLRRQPLT